MRVAVQFPYAINCRRKGRRLPTVEFVRGSADLDIASPDPAEAPVAFSLHATVRGRPAVNPTRRDLRLHDGAVWWPLRPHMNAEDISADQWIAALDGSAPCETATLDRGSVLPGGDAWPERTTRDLNPPVTEVIRDGHDRALALMRARAEDLMICDGKVYVRGNEPLYLISMGKKNGRPITSLTVADGLPLRDGAKESLLSGDMFRADRLPDAQARFRTVAVETSAPADDIVWRIDVMLPQAVTADPLTPYLRYSSAKLAHALEGAKFTDDVVAAKDALIDAIIDPDVDAATAAAALGSLLDRIDADSSGVALAAAFGIYEQAARALDRAEAELGPARHLHEAPEPAASPSP